MRPRPWDAPAGLARSRPASRPTCSCAMFRTIGSCFILLEGTMPGASSSEVRWFTRLLTARPQGTMPRRSDDSRLDEVVEAWQGNAGALQPGRAVLVGFPQ